MCGICGYISELQYERKVLKAMNDTMVHRGPDDSGVYQRTVDSGCQIGIAQRRLSIIDLSSAGHQPMFSEDGNIGIVYNGEIYNFKDIKSIADFQAKVPLSTYEDYEPYVERIIKN